MKRLQPIWDTFETLKKLLGLTRYQSRIKNVVSKVYFALLISNSLACVGLCFFKALKPGEELVSRFEGAFFGIAIFFVLAFFWVLILNTENIEEFLCWFERLHAEAQEDPEVKEVFEKSADKATKLFEATSFRVPGGMILLGFVQCLAFSAMRRRFEPQLEIYLCDDLSHRIVVTIMIFGLDFVMLLSLQFMQNLLFTVIRYSIALMNAMKIKLEAAETQAFNTVIEMHCDLIAQLRDFSSFMATPMLLLEAATYGVLISIWIIVFFEPKMLVVALAASGVFVLYAFNCWMNEDLASAFDDLSGVLYNLKWYEMEPKQRRTILLIMMMANQPKLLVAGPFHVIGYEELSKLLNSTYSWGLIVNDFLKKYSH